MLANNDICAVLAVKDMAAAKEFYEGTLGLKAMKEDPGGGVFYGSGKGGVLVYPSQYAGTNQATAAAWSVEDIDAEVAELKGKGVTFEHYDMPGMTVEGDIHVMGPIKGAWFKDPSGNILNIVSGM